MTDGEFVSGGPGKAATSRRDWGKTVISSVRWLSGNADPDVLRIRNGRVAGGLLIIAGAYWWLLRDTREDPGTALGTVMAVLGLLLLALPWRRMPDWTVLRVVPTVLTGLVVAQSIWHEPGAALFLYELTVAFCGLALGVRGTLLVAGCTLTGFSASVIAQGYDGRADLITGAVVSSLIGLLIAVTVLIQRWHWRDLSRLHHGLGALVDSKDLAETAQRISALATQLMSADGATLVTRESRGSPVLVGRGGFGRGEDYERIRIDPDAEGSVMGLVARTRQWVFIQDAASDARVHPAWVKHFGVSSTLSLPLLDHERELVGVLGIWWSSLVPDLDTFDQEVVQLLSVQAGPILARAVNLEDLDRAAATDPLTGIANRRAFDERMGRIALDDALLICDLDRFKHLNDTQGHAAGDRILRAFAAALSASVRQGDLVARLGGDEFAVVVGGGRTGAENVLARIRQNWSDPEGVGASIGFAVADPGESGEALTERADAELYASKRARRPSPHSPDPGS